MLTKLKKGIRHPSYIGWKLAINFTDWKKSRGRLRFIPSASASGQTRTVMFHGGRSGSTVLADQLNQHPEISWANELYERIEDYESGPPERIRAEFWALVDDALERRSHYAALGFEVKFFHLQQMGLSLEEFLDELRAREFDRFIVLERKNKLRKIVSTLIARDANKWHLPPGVSASKSKITVPITDLQLDVVGERETLIGCLDRLADDFARLEHALSERRVLRLSYENDISDAPENAASQCAELLELEPVAFQVRYGRTNPFPLEELIDNYGEVCAALAGTRHQWMV